MNIVTPEKPVDRIEWVIRSIELFFESILAFTALSGIAIAVLTLISIEYQARETARSAKATETQAAAFVSSERAWIIAELMIFDAYRDKEGNWFHLDHARFDMDDVFNDAHLYYFLRLTNMGRTPATILGFRWFHTRLAENVRDLPGDPSSDYAEFQALDHPLGGGQSYDFPECLIRAGAFILNKAERLKSKQTDVFHGWVEYQHIFNDREFQQADFRYVYSPQKEQLVRARHNPEKQQTNPN